MKKKLKLSLLLVIILSKINAELYSQKDSIKLQLKDYHSAQVTDILATKNEKRIITFDASGKIIKYNSSDFSYNTTLKKSDGFGINNPRIVFDEKGLLYTSKDSLWIINSKGKIMVKKPFKGRVISGKSSPFIIVTETRNFTNSGIGIFDNKFAPIGAFETKNTIKAASVSIDTSFIAYIEEDLTRKQKLILRNLKTKTTLWEYNLQDDHKLVYPFFDRNNNLFAITVSADENLLSIYNFKDGKRQNKPEAKIDWFSLYFSTNVSDELVNKETILINAFSSFSGYPLRITLKNKNFKIQKIAKENGAFAGIYIKDKKEVVLANTYNSNFNSFSTFSIYGLTNKLKESFPKNFSQKFYQGYFLKDNSTLNIGYDSKTHSYKVKYFEKGTFSNRFSKLNLYDYIEVNHNIYVSRYDIFFDKINGLFIFNGQDLATNKYHIYIYNFEKDTIETFLDLKPNENGAIKLKSFLDYLDGSLITSPRKYYNRGHTKPQPISVIRNKKEIAIKGVYKFAKFSKKAKHMLTLNDKNLVEIRTKDGAVVFKDQVKGDDFIVNKIDDSFIISYNFFEKFKLQNESKFYIKNKDSFTIETKPYLFFNQILAKNNYSAAIFKDLGFGINNTIIKSNGSIIPQSISFNNDASKLMVSYSNGKISVLNTSTLKEIGGVFHPSDKEHIFFDTKNHYFSNIDAGDFLLATKNGERVPLEEVDNEVFNPAKVLSVFGNPNKDYLTLLQKATSLRKNAITNRDAITSNDKNKKGDLYVLSIGVSRYKQNQYNLTFADKDAFDIASIYGKLDSMTISNFKDEFLGKKYYLNSLQENNMAKVNLYTDLNTSFSRLKNFYQIDSDKDIWIEINGKNNFLWSFNNGTISKIKTPKNLINIDLSFRDNENIFHSSNKDEIYIKTLDNIFYKFNAKTQQIKKINFPFDLDNIYDFESLKPIKNNKWIYISQKDSRKEILSIVGKENSNKRDTIIYPLNKYNSSGKIIKLEDWETIFINVKNISKDGKLLLYTDSGENAHILELSKGKIPTKLPIKIAYSHEATLSEDGSKICVLDKLSKDYRYKVTTYNLKGEVLATKTLIDKEYNVKGLSIVNANPKWVETSPSLLDDFKYSSFSSFETLSNSTPFSFKNTFVKKITNEEATKEKIENEISEFLKNTKEEDQVIIFLAGHGVLDKKNSYFYAPYDMDFSDSQKKGVSFTNILEGLTKTKALKKLLLMDTCHSGNTLDIKSNTNNNDKKTKTKNSRGTDTTSKKDKPSFKLSSIISSLFKDFTSTSGVTILSASSGGDVAYENKTLSNGAFTSAYLKVLKSKLSSYAIKQEDTEKTVILDESFMTQIFKEVLLLTNGKQLPDIREVNKNVIIKAW